MVIGKPKYRGKGRKSLGVCPICVAKIKKPNRWVRFHVRYSPPIEIMACSFCNFAEFKLRTGGIRYGWEVESRIPAIRNFFAKFGIDPDDPRPKRVKARA